MSDARFTPGGPWIQTFTGRAVHLLDPRAEEIHIDDIAHALAHLCRYTGHVDTFYSVAEHSIWASFLAPAHLGLAALLHDATEAYINDLSKPLKNLLPEYERIERRMWLAIAERFGIPSELPAEIKKLDKELLMAEYGLLMKSPPAPWGYDVVPAPNFTPQCMAPKIGELAFLKRFGDLTRDGAP